MTGTVDQHPDNEQLSALIDERLEAGERTRIAEHIAICESCSDGLEGLRATAALLRRLPALEPGRSFVLSETTRRPLDLRLASWTRLAGALAAVLCVTLISAEVLGGLVAVPTVPGTAQAPTAAVERKAIEAARPAGPAAQAVLRSGPAQDQSGEASAAVGSPPQTAPTRANEEARGPVEPAGRATPSSAGSGPVLRPWQIASGLLAAALLLLSVFMKRRSRT